MAPHPVSSTGKFSSTVGMSMSPHNPQPGSPQEWLQHSRSDLALARLKKTRTVLYQHLCFHAQQAAEKAIKAVLISRCVRFPRTHDLAYLLDLLPSDVRIPPLLIDLPSLTKYAVQHRYPAETPPVTAKHRRLAVQLAENAIAWATRCAASAD